MLQIHRVAKKLQHFGTSGTSAQSFWDLQMTPGTMPAST
jgi:hypothetical protein